jgi:hypothetical protein
MLYDIYKTVPLYQLTFAETTSPSTSVAIKEQFKSSFVYAVEGDITILFIIGWLIEKLNLNTAQVKFHVPPE